MRDTPISEQAILGAGHGRGDDRSASPSPRSCSRTSSRSVSTTSPTSSPRARYMTNGQTKCPLVVRTGNGARLALRRAALPVRRELVHDDSRPRRSWRRRSPRGRGRPAGRRRARSRSGDLLGAQVALRDQGRSAGRRDRRHAGHRQDPAARQGRHHRRPGADGAARARRRREADRASTASTAK